MVIPDLEIRRTHPNGNDVRPTNQKREIVVRFIKSVPFLSLRNCLINLVFFSSRRLKIFPHIFKFFRDKQHQAFSKWCRLRISTKIERKKLAASTWLTNEARNPVSSPQNSQSRSNSQNSNDLVGGELHGVQKLAGRNSNSRHPAANGFPTHKFASVDDEKIPLEDSPEHEREILQKQISIPEVRTTFVTLYRYATTLDLAIIVTSGLLVSPPSLVEPH